MFNEEPNKALHFSKLVFFYGIWHTEHLGGVGVVINVPLESYKTSSE